jgi:outer membrane protein OmpA-like peptidoglycan-associated protein
LRDVGEKMREYPQTRLVLRGYSAPRNTEESQITLSAARVWYIADYLMGEYGIPEERIRMAFYGARDPSGRTDNNSRRRVELFSEPLDAPDREPPVRTLTAGSVNSRISPVRYTVYFGSDSHSAIPAQYLPQLREAGRRLRANPRLTVTLRGYAGPSGTRDGQIISSAAQVWACAEYLKMTYGISERRMRMGFYGMENQNPRRRVEITIQ